MMGLGTHRAVLNSSFHSTMSHQKQAVPAVAREESVRFR
jgi:hypothetical protein